MESPIAITRLRRGSIRCCAALAVAAFVGVTAAANPAPNQAPANNDNIPLIVIDNLPLVDAIRNLAWQAGGNYILDLRVSGSPGPPISVRVTNATAREGLDTLLKEYKLTLVTNPVTTVSRIAPTRLGVKPVPASQVGTNAGAAIPLLVMDDVPLTEAVTKLAEAAQLKVSLDPKWAESAKKGSWTASFRWEKITARQALAALLDNYDLTLIEEAGGASARVTVKAVK